jgi:hypothetical protein
MKQNMHNVERVIRLIVALFVLSLIFWGPTTLWGLLGLIPLFTGLTGWCPLYTILGISTKRRTKEQPGDLQSQK